MSKRLAVSMTILGGLLLLPVAIGDFQPVAPAHAAAAVPEPGTLVLVTVGLIGAGFFKRLRGR